MKVKKFIASSMPEAMQQIRTELGKDAVILQSKEVKPKGIFSLFKKPQVEVVAALDPKPIPKRTEQKPRQLHTAEKLFHPNQLGGNQPENIVSEIKHLRKMIEQQASSQANNFTGSYQLLFDYLSDQEVDEVIAQDLILELQKMYEDPLTVPIEKLLMDLKILIKNRLDHLSFSGIKPTTRIVQLIGPTGVGKTTTLAKLAAKSLLEDKKSIAFITMDTYRIAAIEQLKTYARILEVPVEVAYSLEDYKQAINKLSQYDLIFVDTAGRNFRESSYVDELTKYIESTKHTEVFFVAALTAKYRDVLYTLKQFEHVENKKIIFTKADETRQYGSLLNVGLQDNIDISFLTNGQDVPQDIETLSAERISHYIMSGYHGE